MSKRARESDDEPVVVVSDVIRPEYLLSSDEGTHLLVSSRDAVRKAYQEGKPFKHGVLPNFLHQSVCEKIRQEVLEEELVPKDNDLYQFNQTQDAKNTTKPNIAAFRRCLFSSEFRKFLSSVAGVALDGTVDIAGQVYKKGGHLLCHDDELEGRVIAFILYLVEPSWTRENGGTLDLFEVDDNGQPTQPSTSIIPKWNQLAFFEVNPVSFHQVSEILGDQNRVTLTGWFHGKSLPRPPKYVEASIPEVDVEKLEGGCDLSSWVNPRLLRDDVKADLSQFFEENSSVALLNFLLPEKYDALFECMKKTSEWKMIGPADRRHHYSIGRHTTQDDGDEIAQFRRLIQSKEFIAYLQEVTGLTLTHAQNGEARKFSSGCYTMVHDNVAQHSEEGLDILFGLHNPDPSIEWKDAHGGFTTYMDEEAELATLPPEKNNLSIVYRDKGCMRFVKYLSSDCPCDLYDVQNTYKVAEDDEEDAAEGDSAPMKQYNLEDLEWFSDDSDKEEEKGKTENEEKE